jgi:Domain of unknown function (DUF4124)
MKNRGDGMKSVVIVMVLIFTGIALSGVQAEIYSWTDENGVKHYSHTPPADRSVLTKTAPEIQSGSTDDQTMEKINEENIDIILEELDKKQQAATPRPARAQKPPSRNERIQAEREQLEDKIEWLKQLPPEAYTNMRSKQAIIGRYQYRMEQLIANPDAYLEKYGN